MTTEDDRRDVSALSEGLGQACTVDSRCDKGGSGTPCATNGAAGCFILMGVQDEPNCGML